MGGIPPYKSRRATLIQPLKITSVKLTYPGQLPKRLITLSYFHSNRNWTTLDGLQNISANWKTVKAAAGTSAQLMCQAFHSTFIDANTFWLFQGVMLNDALDARFKIGEFRWKSFNFSQTVEMKIEINNLSVSDFGSYSCAINTTAGVSSELVFLEVQNEERGNVLYVTYLFIYSFIYLYFIYLFIHNFYVLMYFCLTFRLLTKNKTKTKTKQKTLH